MLFMVTQSHAPEQCPIDAGGLEALHAKPADAPRANVVAAYGAFTDHVLYYVVEASDYDAVEKFLLPGFKRCRATITPVRKFLG